MYKANLEGAKEKGEATRRQCRKVAQIFADQVKDYLKVVEFTEYRISFQRIDAPDSLPETKKSTQPPTSLAGMLEFMQQSKSRTLLSIDWQYEPIVVSWGGKDRSIQFDEESLVECLEKLTQNTHFAFLVFSEAPKAQSNPQPTSQRLQAAN